MTIPAKYSLTEAHFIIVELERELDTLHTTASAMARQVDEMAEQRVTMNARIKKLEAALYEHGKHISLHAFHPEDGCLPTCVVCQVLEEDA